MAGFFDSLADLYSDVDSNRREGETNDAYLHRNLPLTTRAMDAGGDAVSYADDLLGNIPQSATNAAQGAFDYATHPVETAKAVGNAMAHPVDTANNIYYNYKDRYGSLPQFADTLRRDPVGTAFDFMPFRGVAAGVRSAANAGTRNALNIARDAMAAAEERELQRTGATRYAADRPFGANPLTIEGNATRLGDVSPDGAAGMSVVGPSPLVLGSSASSGSRADALRRIMAWVSEQPAWGAVNALYSPRSFHPNIGPTIDEMPVREEGANAAYRANPRPLGPGMPAEEPASPAPIPPRRDVVVTRNPHAGQHPSAPVQHAAPSRRAAHPARDTGERFYGDYRDAEPFASDPIGGFIDDLTGNNVKTSRRKGTLADAGFSDGGVARKHYQQGGGDAVSAETAAAEPPDELTFEQAHPAPQSSEVPDELTFAEAHPDAPEGAGQPTLRGDIALATADALRGARATLPFAKDISSATRAYVGNPLTQTGPSGDFAEEKRAVDRQQDQSWERNPEAYTAGAVAGLFAPGSPVSKINKALPAAERFIAEKAAPYLGEGLARTAATALPVTATGAVLGAGEGATADERLSNALVGGVLGAGGGLAGDVAAPVLAGVGRGIDKLRAMAPVSERAKPMLDRMRASNPFAEFTPAEAAADASRYNLKPTGDLKVEDLAKAAKDAYDAVDAHNVLLRPDALRALHKNITGQLREAGYRANNTPELQEALDELLNAGRSSTGVKLKDLEVINRIANAATTSQNASSRLHGGMFKSSVNDFLANIAPTSVLNGNSHAARAALEGGREMWKRKSKLEDVENLIENIRTASNANGRDIHKHLRAQLEPFISAAEKSKRWTGDEIAAMRNVINPGFARSVIRAARHAAPSQHLRAGAVEGAAVLSHFHAPEAIAAGLGGEAAKLYSKHAMTQRLNDLKQLIARGGDSTRLARSAVGDEAKSRALVGTALPASLTADFGYREGRASGGAVKLAGIEKALSVAQRAISQESKPIMDAPDETVAAALNIAARR
jgi:hypothetical protein